MKISCIKLLSAFLALATAAVSFAQMPGDLVVTPTRVALDDKAKSSDITIVNRGSQTVRYRLTLVDMEMSQDGILHRVAGTDNSAIPVLRLSPREIVLEPGSSQRIKIAAFFPPGSADKELRSHLAFEPIATPKVVAQTSPSGDALKLSFELRSVVTIPVVAQHGRLEASTSMSGGEVVMTPDGWVARCKITRNGTRTTRGDLMVWFTPAGGGSRVEIGSIVGLPVYFPNADRIVTVRLTKDIRSLGKGEIEISYAEPKRSKGAATARTVVELSG
jgi:hypothetical protein